MTYTIELYEGYNIKTYDYRGGYRWTVILALLEVRTSTDCNDMIWTTAEEATDNAKAYIDTL